MTSGAFAVTPASHGAGPLDPGQAAAPGRFKFQLHSAAATAAPADAASPTPRQLDLLADRLPLAPLEPWLARVLPEARLLGMTSADIKVTWLPAAATATTAKATVSAGGQPTPSVAFAGASTGGAGGVDVVRAGAESQTGALAIAGRLDAADLRFSSAALSGDLLELPTAAISIDATIAGSRLSARQFVARAAGLDAEATGDFDLAQLAALGPEQLPQSDAVVTARVDLPTLTRMLPRTLHIRPGVRIDSGDAELTIRSKADDGGRRWTLAASVENLLGHDGARPIRWTQPVEAGIDLAATAAGPQLKRVLLRSPFASISAEGTTAGLEGEVSFNLRDLAAQAGQFVDLSQWRLEGTGQGTFSWRETGPDKFAADAGLDLARIDVRKGDRVVWVDPELHLELQGSGLRLAARPLRIETGTALMRGPRDTLELELLEPVDLTAAHVHDQTRSWFLRIKGEGPLDSWAGRLRPWVAAVPDELAGQATVNARVRASGALVEVAQSQVSLRDFRTRVAGVELLEQRIEAGGDFRWDAARRSIDAQDLTLTSSTVAAKARGVEIRLADGGPPTIRGDIAFRGDLERIAAWAGRVGVPGTLWPRGQGVGRMQLASDAIRASARIELTAEPFTLVRLGGAVVPPAAGVQGPAAGLQPAVAWNEPSLKLGTEVAYTHADDRLQVASLRLDGHTVQLTGTGVVDQLRTARSARGDATLTYDSNELAKLLAAYLGPGVRLSGAAPLRLTAEARLSQPGEPPGASGPNAQFISTAAAPFPGAAPHWSRACHVTAETSVAAASLYGLPIGPAALVANIRDGQIQLHPLDLAVGQGRLTAQPRVILDPAPQALQFAAGPFASNVAVSTEVSEAMLKYGAPILADATRVSGTFSLMTEGVHIPLDNPRLLQSKGRLTMHQLSILPGPGLQDVVALVQRLEMLARGRDNLLGALAQPAPEVRGITMNERTVDVQVVDGRVYHRNLEFLIDDVPVSSFGSVGFDQTVSLVLRVPVQEKWVRGTRELQPLIGQVIEIPVSGTMSRWNVDERAVGAFLGQAAQTAVGGVIENELNKALEGLFKKK
ncbi:MAG TPA: hypothetical protein VEQ85_03040 [Lacipirellulaceae bacterium]|nr:hypothetical protein [Lacipirellulaceae bacterium]